MAPKAAKSLPARAHVLADLIATGADVATCAAQTGYPREYVEIMLQSPFFQALVDHKRGETLSGLKDIIQSAMERAVPEAFESIRYLASDARNESVRQRAAEFLVQYGFGPPPGASQGPGTTGPAVQIVFEGYDHAPQTIAAVLEHGRTQANGVKPLETYAHELEEPSRDP